MRSANRTFPICCWPPNISLYHHGHRFPRPSLIENPPMIHNAEQWPCGDLRGGSPILDYGSDGAGVLALAPRNAGECRGNRTCSCTGIIATATTTKRKRHHNFTHELVHFLTFPV